MGLRTLTNVKKICHWSSAGIALKTSLLDIKPNVLSALARSPHGLLVQDPDPGTWHAEYKIAR